MKFLLIIGGVFLSLMLGFSATLDAQANEQEKTTTVSFTIYDPRDVPQVLKIISFEREKFFRIKILSKPYAQLQLSQPTQKNVKQYQTNSEGIAWVEVDADDLTREVELLAIETNGTNSPTIKIPLSHTAPSSIEGNLSKNISATTIVDIPIDSESVIVNFLYFRFFQFLGISLIGMIIYFIISPASKSRSEERRV